MTETTFHPRENRKDRLASVRSRLPLLRDLKKWAAIAGIPPAAIQYSLPPGFPDVVFRQMRSLRKSSISGMLLFGTLDKVSTRNLLADICGCFVRHQIDARLRACFELIDGSSTTDGNILIIPDFVEFCSVARPYEIHKLWTILMSRANDGKKNIFHLGDSPASLDKLDKNHTREFMSGDYIVCSFPSPGTTDTAEDVDDEIENERDAEQKGLLS